jgi:hypothetical protein
MNPVDKSVCLIEFVTQAGHPAAGNQSSVTLDTSGAAFGGFDLFRDFVDVRVQRLQQLFRLCCVGVIDHVGIIAPNPIAARAGADSANRQRTNTR